MLTSPPRDKFTCMGVVRTVVSGLLFLKKRDGCLEVFTHPGGLFTYPLAPISLENHVTVVKITLTSVSNLLGPPQHGSGWIEAHNDSKSKDMACLTVTEAC